MICVVIWVILRSDEEFRRIYSAFRSSTGASITVSLSPGPQTFGVRDSTNSVCTCICLCVCACEIKGREKERRKKKGGGGGGGVGYQSETSVL